jgi:hypothetical protein
LRAAEAACGEKIDYLESLFCAPAAGVIHPNRALRSAYDALEIELAKKLS